jgi:hypothetical protein
MNDVSIRAIGDWQGGMRTYLDQALAVSMDVIGRTGEEACRHSLILMAQSARALAKQSHKNREVLNETDSGLGQYVNTYKQGNSTPHRVYKFQFSDKLIGGRQLQGTWERAKRIKNRGLAKRSWMWGLSKLGVWSESRPIPGASKFWSILSDKVCGYIKENKLSYIYKAMPMGWENAVESAAKNKIMAQARLKMERQWVNSMAGGNKAARKTLQQFFRQAA